MITALMRPRLLSCKNRWRTSSRATRIYRDITILVLSIAMMVGLYRGTSWALEQMTNLPFLVYVPPALPLGLLLMLLMAMSVVSALAHAIGHLYMADDLDLLLASPASPQAIFFARFSTITLSVSWMPFIFLLPVILALGMHYQAPASFYVLGVVGILPYFVIPCAAATLLASLLMSIIDPRWTKALVVGSIVLALTGVWMTASSFSTVISLRHDPNQLMRVINTMTAANTGWLPSTWLATYLSELITPTGKKPTLHLTLLYSTALACVALAAGVTDLVLQYAYTKARNSSRARTGKRSSLTHKLRKPDPPRSHRHYSPQGAIILKEIRTIFRDLAHSSQVLLLTGLCALYLTNMRLFIALDTFPLNARAHWEAIFLVMHMAITTFFTASLGTRLVFPSVSLEGKHFWLLQIAPLPLSTILRSKCIAWFIPISLLTALLFSIGVHLIVGRIEILLLFTLLSLVISYCLIATGIGLGALFADFSWEHPSQLAMSLGGFIYMLASALIMVLNVSLLTVILKLHPTGSAASNAPSLVITALLALLIIALNMLIANTAIRIGEKALIKE